MNYNGQRKVSLSVSKQNKHLMDTVDDYGTEWGTDFSNTLFEMVAKYDKVMHRLKSSKWELLQEVARV